MRSCFIKKKYCNAQRFISRLFFLFYLLAYINMGVWIFTENVIWEIKRTMHLNHIWSYFLCNTSIQQCHFSRLNRIEKKIIKKLSNSSILFKIHQCFRRQIYFAFFSCMQNLLPIEIETFLICEINSSRKKNLIKVAIDGLRHLFEIITGPRIEAWKTPSDPFPWFG